MVASAAASGKPASLAAPTMMVVAGRAPFMTGIAHSAISLPMIGMVRDTQTITAIMPSQQVTTVRH